MKNFAGLLKKEWVLYRAWLFGGIFIGIMLSMVVPYLIRRFSNEFTMENQLPFFFSILVLMLGGFFSVLQYLVSIRNDLRTKEIWLHSTSSIAQLVGVKIVFSLIGYAIFNFIFVSIAIYNVKDGIIGNFAQILLLLIFTVAIIVIFQLMMFVIVLLFFAFNFQMKHFIGNFSVVITMFTFFFSLNLWFEFTKSKLYDNIFHRMGISLTGLEQFFPKSPTMNLSLSTMYIVDEVATFILVAILFFIATKWLEKVVLR
ncbi:MFS family permease [Lysinibacillus sp. RC46]